MRILICLLGLVCLSTTSYVFAASSTTQLGSQACTAGPAIAETPYQIDFGTFSANEVNGVIHYNNGLITTGSATPYTSNFPSISDPMVFLSVTDPCGTGARHADILASDLIDQNVENNITANPIAASNISIAYLSNGLFSLTGAQGGYSEPYFLGSTPFMSDVSINVPITPTTIESPTEVLTRVAGQNVSIAGHFGARPALILGIPAYQQPDIYQGTITWTVVY